jgi:hypothetical protein
MSAYTIPEVQAPVAAKASEVVVIASGDLRLSANQVCWPAQVEVERAVTYLNPQLRHHRRLRRQHLIRTLRRIRIRHIHMVCMH